jgi:hypothetical protein
MLLYITYILYSNGARTLNLRSIRYDARRSRLESGIPAVCSLCMSPVVQTVLYYLDTSRNMTATYVRSLKLSVTYSVKCSSCSIISRPDKKANCLSGADRYNYRVFLFITLPMISNKLTGRLSCGKARLLLGFGMDIPVASSHVFGEAVETKCNIHDFR